MDNEQKKAWLDKLNVWLPNLYYVGTLITLALIMAQVFYAKRSMVESSEWEKAKMTIDNIKQFKENLPKTVLYGQTEALAFSDWLLPDFSVPENFKFADTLIYVYWSICDGEQLKLREDFEQTLSILNDFAYPIIMGYASEKGSFQNAFKEYCSYCNYIMPYAFKEYVNMGHHAKLLYRLWRVRFEQLAVQNPQKFIEHLEEAQQTYSGNFTDYMLCFEGTEITPSSLEKYGKKLDKELIKIQKEIEVFRKNSLK